MATRPHQYLYLPEATHGKREYGAIKVSLYRLHAPPSLLRLCKSLEWNVATTAQEQNGSFYLGDITHPQAMTLVKVQQSAPLSLRRYVDFLREVRGGAFGRKEVYDATGKQIPQNALGGVWKEIKEGRGHWRGEWLSDQYRRGKNALRATFDYINAQGEIEEATETLDDCLMEGKTPGIDLDNWLDHATPQGLPPSDVKKGVLWYWVPRDNTVAGFYAGRDYAYLDCGGNPQGSYAALGVRQTSAAGAKKF